MIANAPFLFIIDILPTPFLLFEIEMRVSSLLCGAAITAIKKIKNGNGCAERSPTLIYSIKYIHSKSRRERMAI